MSRVATVFKLNPQRLNLRRGITLVAAMLVPLLVLGVLNQEKYFLSVAFGALFVG